MNERMNVAFRRGNKCNLWRWINISLCQTTCCQNSSDAAALQMNFVFDATQMNQFIFWFQMDFAYSVWYVLWTQMSVDMSHADYPECIEQRDDHTILLKGKYCHHLLMFFQTCIYLFICGYFLGANRMIEIVMVICLKSSLSTVIHVSDVRQPNIWHEAWFIELWLIINNESIVWLQKTWNKMHESYELILLFFLFFFLMPQLPL